MAPKPVTLTRPDLPTKPQIIVVNPVNQSWRQVPFGFPETTAGWAIVNESANPIEFAFEENTTEFLNIGGFDMMTFLTRPAELWIRGTVAGQLFRFIAWKWSDEK